MKRTVISSIICLTALISCNKKDDVSYKSGKFSGTTEIKEIISVLGTRIEDNLSTESGSLFVENIDSMNFKFMNSVYAMDRTFVATESNVYHYVDAPNKINDRIELTNKGQKIQYFGTREVIIEGTDTTKFYEVKFTGSRD